MLLKIYLVLQTIYLQVNNMQGKSAMKIGVILDNKSEGEDDALDFAWGYFLSGYQFPNVQYKPVDKIDISNNHILITSMCKQVSDGAIMMIVDYHPNTYSSVQSYAHSLGVPTLIPNGRGSSSYDPYVYDISLLPPTIDAIADVIKFFRWYSVVYYLFDTNDDPDETAPAGAVSSGSSLFTGLLRLQKLYQSFDDIYTPTIRARRIINVDDCYEILRKIDHSGPPPKRIVLDLSSRYAYNSVLQKIVDVGMNREGYHYILGILGIDELDLDIFVYGGVNITGFSIVDMEFHTNAKLLSAFRKNDNLRSHKLTTDVALVMDTVDVMLNAAKTIEQKQKNAQGGYGRGRSHRSGVPNVNSCCNCSGEILRQTFDGKQMLEELNQVNTYGLTGNVEFDNHGSRTKHVFYVHHLEHKKKLRQVGSWTQKNKLNTTLAELPPLEAPTIHPNKTFRVTTIISEPFVQYKKSSEKNGWPLVDGRFLEGYCIDLAKLISEASTTKYEYKIELVGDGQYGTRYVDQGCWNGMVGELISEEGCPVKSNKRSKADIAIAPLTISRERQRVVDFTKPFMQTGISIMIKKPEKDKPGVFSFMYPLSGTVWLCVTIAFLGVSLVLFFVGRWSPYEWSDQEVKDGTPVNNFNLSNTFWFSLGALMQQGSDTFPRSYSGRIVGSAWWFFTLILISSYTANLAAFLTIERLTPPIGSADDLVNNPKMTYGTLSYGSSRSFFETSNVDVYRRMWQFMKSNDRMLAPSIPEGVKKVRQGKGLYAFMLESAFNAYHNQRKPCNTMKVGTNLDNKGYGIATPLLFPLRTQLNLAVLHLREIGELKKLEQKWWYAKGMCGTTSKDATTSALTLSNVSGIFHILVGGLIFAMVIALIEYCIHKRIRKLKQNNAEKTTPMGNRIVKKQTLEALKEVGYHERENSGFHEYPSPGLASSVAAPLVTFTDTGLYSHTKQGH